MGSIDKAARQFYATGVADKRIPEGHPQRGDLEDKSQSLRTRFQ